MEGEYGKGKGIKKGKGEGGQHDKGEEPYFPTNVTCVLTAKKPRSAPCPTFVIEYETTLLCFRRLLYILVLILTGGH